MRSDATSRSVSEALARLRQLPDTPALAADREWVFILQADEPPCVRICKTQSLLRKRIVLAQDNCPVPLRLVTAFSAPAGACVLIRAKFVPLRTHSDWFMLTPALADFIRALPKGEPLSPSVIETWASQLRT